MPLPLPALFMARLEFPALLASSSSRSNVPRRNDSRGRSRGGGFSALPRRQGGGAGRGGPGCAHNEQAAAAAVSYAPTGKKGIVL